MNTVNDTQINGLVLRAPKEIPSCGVEGQAACKRIAVTNPGGRRQDRVRSATSLYNLVAGPPPVIESIVPNTGPSIGTTGVLISGTNLDFVRRVTFRSIDVITTIRQNQGVIAVLNPANCIGDATIEVVSVDNLSANKSGYRYHATTPTPVVPVLSFPSLEETFIVGGCNEAMTAALVSASPSCLKSVSVRAEEVALPDPRLPGLGSTVRAFQIKVTFNSSDCDATDPPTPGPARIDVRLTNTQDQTRVRVVTVTRNF